VSLIWRYPVVRDAGGRCVVVALHDGDTFRLLLDCGADAGVFPWLRLAGVYCPELNAPGGVEAAEFTAARLAAAGRIEVTLMGRSFARWVARVVIDGADLAGTIIAAGHGTAAPTMGLMTSEPATSRAMGAGVVDDPGMEPPEV